MNLFIGLGSTGARTVAHTVDWARKLDGAGGVGALVIGLDTNEAEIQNLNAWINTVPAGWAVHFRPIGKDLKKDLAADGDGDGDGCSGGLKVAQLRQMAGGVVATHTGAGNRRLLGLWSYCAPPPKADIWNRDNLFGGGGVLAAAGAPIGMAVVVGSLLGGTASGAFPRVGADLQGVGAPAGPIGTRVAVAILPRPNHPSAVRKANALAALRDLKLQQAAGIWTHVLLVSPGYQDGGGGNWLVAGGEQASLEGLLKMLGLYLLALAIDGKLLQDNGKGLPNGMYILGLRGHYAPKKETLRAKALTEALRYLKEKLLKVQDERKGLFRLEGLFSLVRGKASPGPFLAALEDPGANQSLVAEPALQTFLRRLKNAPPIPPAVGSKINRSRAVIRSAWDAWKDTVGKAKQTPAGLFSQVESLVRETWSEGVVKKSREKQVWSENPQRMVFEAYRVYRTSLFRAIQQLTRELSDNDIVDLLVARYAVHEFAPQLEWELQQILFHHLPQIRRFLETNLANATPPPPLPNFANPLAGIGQVAVPAPAPPPDLQMILKNQFLELLDKAFPRVDPNNPGEWTFDPLVGDDLAMALDTFEKWKAKTIQKVADALQVANPILQALDGGNPLPLVETAAAIGAPAFLKAWGAGGGAIQWNLQAAYYTVTLQDLQLFQDADTKRELRSLSTFNATRYLPKGVMVVKKKDGKKDSTEVSLLDPSVPLGTWWQNTATWVAAGGEQKFAGVPPAVALAVAKLVDLVNPVPCDGTPCFRLRGLPGVYLRQKVRVGAPAANYVVVDGALPGLVWVWGLEYLLPTLPDGDGWAAAVRQYFI